MARPTTALAVLVAARKLITPPENWTRRVNARDANGEPVGVKSKKAVCFCSYGAVGRVAPSKELDKEATGALRNLVRAGLVADFNDNPKTTHKKVLALFDKAIAETRAALSSQMRGEK